MLKRQPPPTPPGGREAGPLLPAARERFGSAYPSRARHGPVPGAATPLMARERERCAPAIRSPTSALAGRDSRLARAGFHPPGANRERQPAFGQRENPLDVKSALSGNSACVVDSSAPLTGASPPTVSDRPRCASDRKRGGSATRPELAAQKRARPRRLSTCTCVGYRPSPPGSRRSRNANHSGGRPRLHETSAAAPATPGRSRW